VTDFDFRSRSQSIACVVHACPMEAQHAPSSRAEFPNFNQKIRIPNPKSGFQIRIWARNPKNPKCSQTCLTTRHIGMPHVCRRAALRVNSVPSAQGGVFRIPNPDSENPDSESGFGIRRVTDFDFRSRSQSIACVVHDCPMEAQHAPSSRADFPNSGFEIRIPNPKSGFQIRIWAKIRKCSQTCLTTLLTCAGELPYV
jgi:uncharacterized protein YraI